MITETQKALLDYIKDFQRDNGVTPSFEQMKDALGLKSKSGVHRLVTALEERGHITRLHGRARAIKVNRWADVEGLLLKIEKAAHSGLNGGLSMSEALRQIEQECRA